MDMKIKFSLIFWLGLGMAVSAAGGPLYAGKGSVTNNGNETVEVKVLKSNGSIDVLTLNPGSSQFLPETATDVMVAPRFGVHRDQVVKVNVVNDAGKENLIQSYWVAHKIGEQKKADTAVQGYAYNGGNVTVRAVITRQNGSKHTQTIYTGGTYYLPSDAVDVDADTLGGARGDEVINVSVVLPNGKKKTIKKG